MDSFGGNENCLAFRDIKFFYGLIHKPFRKSDPVFWCMGIQYLFDFYTLHCIDG